MFKTDPTDTKPCRHMRVWVSALADDALNGFPRWFTEHHVAGCRQCQKGLTTIHAMRDRLHTIHESDDDVPLPPEHWESVEAAWEQADAARTPPTP
jgi:hypothetical protein